MTDTGSNPPQTSLVARADFQYRWRVYVFFLVVVGYGLWSLRDGFFKWPQDNQRWHEMEAHGHLPPEPYHNDAGILINRLLGIILPGVGIPVFIWLMYRSHGAYCLIDGTLHVPGHEPVPLSRIESLDKSRWDRKGLAVVAYHAADGKHHTATLRDMVYERRTTDQIVERIEKSLQTPQPSSAPPDGKH